MSLYGSSGQRKYLTAAERRRFLRATSKLPTAEKLFCLLLAWSGARVSEALALTPDAFDLDAGAVLIETLKRRRCGVVRHVPLPPVLISQLRKAFRLYTVQADPRLAKRRIWRWSRTTAWRIVKLTMKAAGISGLAASPKGLRHSFGVMAFAHDVPPHLVQRWLGHASIKTTAIYGDVLGNEERRFAARMW